MKRLTQFTMVFLYRRQITMASTIRKAGH